MANRVVFGLRSGQYGLWISKPGFNVLTTALENMLFHTGMDAWQIAQSGTIAIANGSYGTISYASQGYVPLVVVVPACLYGEPGTNDWRYIKITNATTTSARINVDIGSSANYQGTCSYAVFKEPASG